MFKNNREIDFGGCIKNFLKNLNFEKNNFVEAGAKVLKNPFFTNFSQQIVFFYTANNYRHCTAFCGVTFPTVIWRYSELQMAVLRDADGSNRNSLMSSAALSTAKLLSET